MHNLFQEENMKYPYMLTIMFLVSAKAITASQTASYLTISRAEQRKTVNISPIKITKKMSAATTNERKNPIDYIQKSEKKVTLSPGQQCALISALGFAS